MRILKKLDVIFTRRQKRSFILLFVMILFGGLLEMVGISMLMPVIMVMIDPQSLRNALASLTESFPFVRNAVGRMGLSSDAKLITFLCVKSGISAFYCLSPESFYPSHQKSRPEGYVTECNVDAV